MIISIYPHQTTDHKGKVVGVYIRASVEFSPREGYDAEKIAELERDLGPYIETRLWDALKKGGEE